MGNRGNQLVQLVYVSAAKVAFSHEQLMELLTIARKNNASQNVTGVLLFQDDTFFQVLEGEPTAVKSLFDKIALDPRHNNVLILAEREVEDRNFSEWCMGFVRDRTEIEDLPGFVDFFDHAGEQRTFLDLRGDKSRIGRILDGFRRGRWRRTANA